MPLRHREPAAQYLPAGVSLLFTFSANLVEGGGILWLISLANNDSVANTAAIFLALNSGSYVAQDLVYVEAIPASTSRRVRGPWHFSSGGTIHGNASAASKISIIFTASEEYLV